LFEVVEAAFDDVAAAVAGLLIVAEVDWATRLLATVGDLVVALRDGRSDPARAQPRTIRFGRGSPCQRGRDRV